MSSLASNSADLSDSSTWRAFAGSPLSSLYRFCVANNPYWLWMFNAVLLIAVVAWLLLDPHFESAVTHTVLLLNHAAQRAELPDLQHLQWRVTVLDCVIYAVILSFGLLVVGIVFGENSPRRRWNLSVSFLVLVLWTSLAFGHSSLAWWAKGKRLQPDLERFEQLAAELRDDWPSADGERAEVGPFMAYPVGNPQTLVLLMPPDVSEWGTAVSVVEHADDGALQFQLAGSEASDWVEWHPPESQPESFVGGLVDVWQLIESKPLGEGWFLARYASCQ